jgi:nucleoside-diphosphate-sugar epimerase
MPFQYIDVKDVAKFIELAISQQFIGEFNLAANSLSRDYFFEILAEVQAKKIVYTNSYKISDYPLHEDELNRGIRTLSSDKALQHGLLVSPIHKTLSYY